MDGVMVGLAIACAAFGCWGAWVQQRRRVAKRQTALDEGTNAISDSGSEAALARARTALEHAQRHWGRGTPPCAPPLEALGRHYESVGDVTRASQFYMRSIDAAGDDEHYLPLALHVRNRLAWCHVALAEWTQAGEQLDAMERLLDSSGEAFVARTALCRATLARERGEPARSESLVKRWLKESVGWRGELDPYRGAFRVGDRGVDEVDDEDDRFEDRVHAYRELAAALEAQGRTADAQRWRLALLGMHERRQDRKGSEYEAQRLALCAEAEEDWERAAEYWQKLGDSRDPLLKTSALVAQGVCELRQERSGCALELFERARSIEKPTEHAEFDELHRWLDVRVAELLALRDPVRALAAFERSGASGEVGDRFETTAIATVEWLTDARDRATKRVEARSTLLAERADAHSDSRMSEQLELASWNVARGRIDAAERCVERARTALRTGGPESAPSGFLSRSVAAMSISLAYYAARFDEAERIVEEVSAEPGDWSAEAWLEVQRAGGALRRGRLEDTVRHYLSALEVTRGQRCSREWLPDVSLQIASALLLSGDRDGARAHFERAREALDGELPELSFVKLTALAVEGTLLCTGDDAVRGEELFSRAISGTKRVCGFAPELRVRWSMLLQERGRNEDAHAAATLALAEAHGIYADSHPLLAFATAVLARVARDEGDRVRARSLFASAHASLSEHAHANADELGAELKALGAS